MSYTLSGPLRFIIASFWGLPSHVSRHLTLTAPLSTVCTCVTIHCLVKFIMADDYIRDGVSGLCLQSSLGVLTPRLLRDLELSLVELVDLANLTDLADAGQPIRETWAPSSPFISQHKSSINRPLAPRQLFQQTVYTLRAGYLNLSAICNHGPPISPGRSLGHQTKGYRGCKEDANSSGGRL